MYYVYSKLQPEIVDIKKKLAKKYNLSYERASQVIDSRFFVLREQLKKTSFRDNKIISVRLYKFAMFYVPNLVKKKILGYMKAKEGEEEGVTNLKINENEQNRQGS
jgi:hypothetical protein